MRLSPLLTLALLMAAPLAAQSVEERYHAAARLYVDGDDRTAEATAEEALRLAPDHRRLQALLEKIRERTPDDSGGGPRPDPDAERPQPGDDQPRPTDQAGGQQPQPDGDGTAPDEHPGEEGDPSDADAPPEGGDPQEGRDGDLGPEGEREGTSSQPGGAAPAPHAEGEMSAEEAERLLRAIEADEQDLIREVQRRRTPRRPVEKDW